jgi:hypothetical protein
MEILHDKIPLPSDFPFMLSDMHLAPFYTMGDHFHRHDCFELSFVKSWSCVYEVEHRQYTLVAGDLMVLNNVEPHRMHVGRDGMNQLLIVFDPSLIWSGARNHLDFDTSRLLWIAGTASATGYRRAILLIRRFIA